MSDNHTPPAPGGSQDQSPGESQEHSAGGSGDQAPGGPQQQGAPPPPEPPQSPPPPASLTGDKTAMLILAYIWILALIPLLVDKDEEVQWHSKNGIVLMLAEVAVWIIVMILGFVPVIGAIIGCGIMPLAFLGFVILRIVGIMKALKGEKLRLPVIADLVDQW